MKMIEDATRKNGKDCIKFVPRTVQGKYTYSLNLTIDASHNYNYIMHLILLETYIRVIDDSGCYSYIGSPATAAAQVLSLQIPG